MLRSICGLRTSLRAPRYGSGSGMILLVGASFDAATRKRYIGIATVFANYAPLLKGGGSRLFLQRMMRFITTLLF
ncbi:hypothetical protein ACVWZZ_001470 [Bradyrhizobium sp. LM6.10]